MTWSRRKLLRHGLTATAAAAALPALNLSAQASGDSPSAPALQTVRPLTDASQPAAARTAIQDLLDHGAHLRSKQSVLLIAYLDGLYGGDNLVDRQTIRWIEQAIAERGNPVEVLWLDEPARPHAWRFPPQARAAMDRHDLTILHSFDLTMEEILAFRNYVEHEHKSAPMVRNFASTAPLLCSSWAQTPNELVSEIRYQASRRIVAGKDWELTDPNGTHLTGSILPARNVTNAEHSYAVRREESNTYLPWPEWICPPIVLANVNGRFVFDRMLSWWSRYIGINPYFAQPITLTVEECRIRRIEGGAEAQALEAFLKELENKLGENVYRLDTMHFGVHPQARVSPQQCASPLYRRLIEHCDTHNLHVHIGSAAATPEYPYWPHITGDLRQPHFRIGSQLVHDHGRLTTLDDESIKAVAARYPGRPGLAPEPFQG